MDASQLRALTLADVGERELRELIAAGETVAERKATVPGEGIGPTIAAFANSGGGWVLIGVHDDGTLKGFRVPGKAHAQDWLRDKLRVAVDPLPPFAAKTMTLDGHDIVLVRVEDSNQTPHLLKATGTIETREPGGRKPIASQARLLELCVRPEQAQARAVQRMTTLPLVTHALTPAPVGEPVSGQTRVSDWMLVASPLTVPEGFHARGLSEATVRLMRDAVLAQAQRLGRTDRAGIVAERPFATGAAVEALNLSSRDGADLMLDAGGVVVGRIRRRLERGAWHVGQTADELITPLLEMTLGILEHCDVIGKTEVHLYVRITPTAPEERPVLTVHTAHTSGELHAPPSEEAFFGGHVLLPTHESTAKDLAERMMRELARSAGIDWWER